MNTTQIQLQYPAVLWAIPLVIPLVLLSTWRSRAGLGARGRYATLLLRLAWAVVAVVAATAPSMRREQAERPASRVVLLEDASSSVAGDADQGETYGRDLLAALGGRTPVDRIKFAGRPWDGTAAPAGRDETDIEAALDAANLRTLDAAAAHVVLISDGRSTRGNAVDAAMRLALRGAAVHTMPIGRDRAASGLEIVQAEPPVDAKVGVPAAVRVTLRSTGPARARLTLLDADGAPVDRRSVTVAGQQTVVLRFTPDRQGTQVYSVSAQALGTTASTPSGDGAAAPVAGRVPVYVSGPPRILLADAFPEEVEALRRSLDPLKIPVDTITPSQWPTERELANYAAVIVSDFSGRELSDAQRAQLREHVERHGCGLLFIGGGNVIPSRWKQNPLAAVLPVVLKDKPADLIKKRPEVSVVFVLDRSGSMSASLPGAGGGAAMSKLDLVKAATVASVKTLPDTAHVAVVTFDSAPTVTVDPTPLSKRAEVIRKIDAIGAGGGTVIDPAAREGLSLLSKMPGDKYMILLTDGHAERPGTDTNYWGAIAQAARADHVSLTTIAVGADADQQMLEFMAREARGKYYYCDTGDKIPQVFLQQANSIRRIAEQKERPFKPRPGPAAADRLRGVALDELPELGGRVRTTARPGVDTLLVGGETGEPLMASWQFGLGRVVAFAADAKGAWGKDWIAWKGFAPFWLQVVQGIMRVEAPLHVRVRTYRADGKVVFGFAVTDENGNPASDLRNSGTLSPGAAASGGNTAPDAPAAPATSPAADASFTWAQPGPGEYLASIPIPSDGLTRLAEMTLERVDGRRVRYSAVVAGGRTAELARVGADLPTLRAIAEAGHGICSTSPADVAAACDPGQIQSTFTQTPLWPALIIIALLMWPIDLAIRKFA